MDRGEYPFAGRLIDSPDDISDSPPLVASEFPWINVASPDECCACGKPFAPEPITILVLRLMSDYLIIRSYGIDRFAGLIFAILPFPKPMR